MSLEATLIDIIERLRQGKFANEQSISQGIILRMFQELGWDTWDMSVVWPEYGTGEGRVDFALCHPPTKPAIFTEVKQPGKAEDSVRQALEYAFRDDLRDMREVLPGGWMVATNLNNVLKKTIIRLAAEVAGLKFGTDVIVEL